MQISILELSGSALYVGTEDGFILEFSLSEGQNERGKTVVRTSKVNTKELSTRSPVTFVRSCSALNRLLVLCDGVLSVLRQDIVLLVNSYFSARQYESYTYDLPMT